MLAGAEENQQGQLGADEAFAGARRRGENQVGHGVGRGVDPPQAGAAQALPARDGLQTLQPRAQHTQLVTRPSHAPTSRQSAAPVWSAPVPVFLREALDELQHAAVGHQVQGALALVVGVVDVGALLREETGDGCADAQLGVAQKTRGAELRVTRGKGQKEGDVRLRSG